MNYQVPQIEWKTERETGNDGFCSYEANTATHKYRIYYSDTMKSWTCTCYRFSKPETKQHKYLPTAQELKEWVETTHYPSALIKAGFEPVIEPLMQRDRIIQSVNTLTDICHSASRNAGWWHDIKTGESLKRNKGEMLMLMVSELAEAMEADRKSLQDDHLPQYDGVSVEIADCLIRIFDFVGGFGLKTDEAMADKIEYNANRADHKIENRLKDNGKKY